MRNAAAVAMMIAMLGPLLVSGCGGGKEAAPGQAATKASGGAADQAPAKEFTLAEAVDAAGSCLAAALAAVGCGLALSRLGSSSVESVARQPEASGSVFTSMVVAAAMIEGGMLLAILVCIMGVMKV